MAQVDLDVPTKDVNEQAKPEGLARPVPGDRGICCIVVVVDAGITGNLGFAGRFGLVLLPQVFCRGVHGVNDGRVQDRPKGIDGQVIEVVANGQTVCIVQGMMISHDRNGDVDHENEEGPDDSRNAKKVNDLVPSIAVVDAVKSEGPGGVFELPERLNNDGGDTEGKQMGHKIPQGHGAVAAPFVAFRRRGLGNGATPVCHGLNGNLCLDHDSLLLLLQLYSTQINVLVNLRVNFFLSLEILFVVDILASRGSQKLNQKENGKSLRHYT